MSSPVRGLRVIIIAHGAFVIFMAFAVGTMVLIIHLTSLPERRRAPEAQAGRAARS